MNTFRKRNPLELAIGLVLILVLSRILPHVPNFTAVMASVIFAGASLRSWKVMAGLLLGYWLSDLAINNIFYGASTWLWYTPGFWWIWVPMILVFASLKSGFLKEMSPFKLPFVSLGASAVFFIISNFGVWLGSATLYTKDLSGLGWCYINAIPFFGLEFAGSLFYSLMIYSVYWLFVEQTRIQPLGEPS
jgi:hypothetical protein